MEFSLHKFYCFLCQIVNVIVFASILGTSALRASDAKREEMYPNQLKFMQGYYYSGNKETLATLDLETIKSMTDARLMQSYHESGKFRDNLDQLTTCKKRKFEEQAAEVAEYASPIKNSKHMRLTHKIFSPFARVTKMPRKVLDQYPEFFISRKAFRTLFVEKTNEAVEWEEHVKRVQLKNAIDPYLCGATRLQVKKERAFFAKGSLDTLVDMLGVYVQGNKKNLDRPTLAKYFEDNIQKGLQYTYVAQQEPVPLQLKFLYHIGSLVAHFTKNPEDFVNFENGQNPLNWHWHHVLQENKGPVVLMPKKLHKARIHGFSDEGTRVNREAFNELREQANIATAKQIKGLVPQRQQ